MNAPESVRSRVPVASRAETHIGEQLVLVVVDKAVIIEIIVIAIAISEASVSQRIHGSRWQRLASHLIGQMRMRLRLLAPLLLRLLVMLRFARVAAVDTLFAACLAFELALRLTERVRCQPLLAREALATYMYELIST